MLERLEIHDFVLIDSLVLDFNKGLTVITGETGSGKSIILSALGLLLGDKLKGDAVRQGAKEASLSALFNFPVASAATSYLAGHGLEVEEGGALVQRIIRRTGRSIMSINGQSVTREVLEGLGCLLVDISSQMAHQSLLRKDSQLAFLDSAAHDGSLLSAYHDAWTSWKKAQEHLAYLEEEGRRMGQEADYMRFCLDELEKASLSDPEEDEHLDAQLRIMKEAGSLREGLEDGLSLLRGGMGEGVVSLLADASASLRKASRIDPSLSSYVERLESASIEIEDVSSSLRSDLNGLSFSEEEMEEKNSRLALLQRMKRKHGGSLAAAIGRRDEYRAALEREDDRQALVEEASKAVEAAYDALLESGERLSDGRRKKAGRLSTEISQTLRQLGLKDAVFSIQVTACQPCPSGMDEVVFMLAANKGEKAGPVSQVASGGELSRIMLALKSVAGSDDEVATLVFDEVDAGLGGRTAMAVSKQLVALSDSHQVIAITHLAQIAARAAWHIRVRKGEVDGRTVSHAEEISGDERIEETARLLSGKADAIALEHARSLLEVQDVVDAP